MTVGNFCQNLFDKECFHLSESPNLPCGLNGKYKSMTSPHDGLFWCHLFCHHRTKPSINVLSPSPSYVFCEWIYSGVISDYSCRFDELVLFWVAPIFLWDSLKEEGVGEKGFLLYRHNAEDNVVVPEAVLGHQEESAKERPAVMFRFSLPYLCVCFICGLCILLSLVLNTPPILNPIIVGLRQDK